MVNDRLHIICGNCGCNDMWSWKYEKEAIDHGDKFSDDVYISCGNCSTLHSLSKYAREKNAGVIREVVEGLE